MRGEFACVCVRVWSEWPLYCVLAFMSVIPTLRPQLTTTSHHITSHIAHHNGQQLAGATCSEGGNKINNI